MDAFECRRCGSCCKVSGYVRLEEGEARRIAEHLGLELREFTDQYTRLTEDRRCLSLNEHPDCTCIFLMEEGGCRIQSVKPKQCRTFPRVWRFEGWEGICENRSA